MTAVDFAELVTLEYFYDGAKDYTISELQERLGCSNEQVLAILDGLIEKGALVYKDGLARITGMGMSLLAGENALREVGQQSKGQTFCPRNHDAAYFPARFLKQIEGGAGE